MHVSSYTCMCIVYTVHIYCSISKLNWAWSLISRAAELRTLRQHLYVLVSASLTHVAVWLMLDFAVSLMSWVLKLEVSAYCNKMYNMQRMQIYCCKLIRVESSHIVDFLKHILKATQRRKDYLLPRYLLLQHFLVFFSFLIYFKKHPSILTLVK